MRRLDGEEKAFEQQAGFIKAEGERNIPERERDWTNISMHMLSFDLRPPQTDILTSTVQKQNCGPIGPGDSLGLSGWLTGLSDFPNPGCCVPCAG